MYYFNSGSQEEIFREKEIERMKKNNFTYTEKKELREIKVNKMRMLIESIECQWTKEDTLKTYDFWMDIMKESIESYIKRKAYSNTKKHFNLKPNLPSGFPNNPTEFEVTYCTGTKWT